MLLSFGMMMKNINIILIIEIFALFSFLFYMRYKAYKAKEETDRWIKKVEEERKRNGENRKV